jgi:uncharacterized membrane protein YcjF (UPF0283 family)
MAATAKADRRAVDRPSAGRRLTTETKSAVKTTEFMAMVAIVAGILISAAVINGGDTQGTDAFIARQAWLYVAIVAAGYMISRGLAKSGSGEPYFNDGTNDNRGHDGHRPDGVSSSAR